jgi:hypothetical protein
MILKNFFIAFEILLFTSSCNDDDNTNQTANFETLIVGEWQLSESFANNEAIILGACELMTTFNFDSNNEFGFVDVITDTNGNCNVLNLLVGTYTLNNAILTYTTSSGQNSQVQVTQLNETILELSVSTESGNLVKVYNKISSQ